MLESSPHPRLGNGHDATHARRQRGKLWLAIVFLVAALAVVLVKDRQFWFSAEHATIEDETSTPASPAKTPSPNPATAGEKTRNHPSAKSSEGAALVVPPAMIEAHRIPVAPLNIQIVDGNKARVLPPARSNALQVQIPADSGAWKPWPESGKAGESGPAVNAVARTRMPIELPGPAEGMSEDSTPLLIKQMKVRGSVVLRALIGADGHITDLRVLSGPAVLAPVAREALRQWRFKPYLQNGLPVETQAQITVSFLITTS
jgi:TonB family protein